MKLPAFQFYPGDWRKDTGVQSLDFEARGVWFEILCLMHESERRGVLTLNGSAMPVDALARLLGLTVDLLNQITTKLEDHGVASREDVTGALVSRRMVRDENIRKVRTEAGKKGGNPNLLNQITTTGVKQKPTPSSSSSSSSSLPPNPQKPEQASEQEIDPASLNGMEPEEAFALLTHHFPDRDVWGEYRRLKKLATEEGTKVTWNRLVAWLKKAGSIAKMPGKNPNKNHRPTFPAEIPLTPEEQKKAAEELSHMRKAAGHQK